MNGAQFKRISLTVLFVIPMNGFSRMDSDLVPLLASALAVSLPSVPLCPETRWESTRLELRALRAAFLSDKIL